MKLAREYLLPSNIARLALATTIHIVLLSLYCTALWKHLPPIVSSAFAKQSLQHFSTISGVYSDFKGTFGGLMHSLSDF